jgi:two-component system, chemotaxis family, protein-glutamate methylesterase/glutaminase
VTEERIVVVGTSAGGVDALLTLVKTLPGSFPAPICVVLHIPPDSPSLLAQILSRSTSLKVKEAEDGERYDKGTVYIAPPDRHLLIADDGTLHVGRGPRENRHRPAVDPLFRSAALSHGRRAIGVILSGTLDDGTAGLMAIKQRGGIALVQDPRDAIYPGMPQSALQNVEVDHVVPVREIADKLVEIVASPLPPRVLKPIVDDDLKLEVKMAELDHDALAGDDRPGEPSPYSCPDCGGVLWEIENGEYVRFRCRVGHAFSPETMLGAQSDKLEEALWAAMKTLEESARLSKRLAQNERGRGHEWLAERFEKKEKDARARVETIRKFLATDSATVPVPPPAQVQSR